MRSTMQTHRNIDKTFNNLIVNNIRNLISKFKAK